MRVPLFIDFSGRNVLIIGGGAVATRRALKFLKAGANIRVIGLSISEELIRLSREGKVEVIVGDAGDDELLRRNMAWADLVVIATNDPGVNEKVRNVAREMRKLFNDATNAEETEVVVPFETEVNGLRIAVTTEGLSGVVARRALKRIREVIEGDTELMNMARVWYAVKHEIKSSVGDVKVRLKLYFDLDSDEKFNELARKGLVREALDYVRKKIRAYS
ncbi:precorrin-2 dehydrogenase/sirohydrochlorin ferrochelatase family protein [Vulcanisaeta thermophila]|uniref:precorrin-2 dehydrogenase/sirohydrochlorin ferrochelatase family protein n=1 Tax=Vulcanisaeta thermophila TaxID=867917 RepID=UPI000852E90D|nr:bifunctional precorrin-2 dehydrogenase/sirohydrochlorin ferrochelatase [Vulcanisaeta thermophila]